MISMNITGLKAVQLTFKNVERRLNKRREINAKAVIIIDRWIQKNFQSQGKEVGGWKKLSDSTIRQRRKGKKTSLGYKILQDTGQLRSRWKHYYNNKIAKVESGVEYGIYHDSDEPRKSKLPRRQIAPDLKHVEKPLLKLFGKMIDKVIDKETK